MNIQKKSPTEMANEICELFDSYGFTSEIPVDSNEIIGKIAGIIEDGVSNIQFIMKESDGELIGNLNTTNLDFERQPGE